MRIFYINRLGQIIETYCTLLLLRLCFMMLSVLHLGFYEVKRKRNIVTVLN